MVIREVDQLEAAIRLDVEGVRRFSDVLGQVALPRSELVFVGLMAEGVVLTTTLTTKALRQDDVEVILVVPGSDLLRLWDPVQELLERFRSLRALSSTSTETVPVVVISMLVSSVAVRLAAVAVRLERLRNELDLIQESVHECPSL